jgi:1,4-dihydroxy-2-naphthoyl-CoA hydrolase
MHFSSSYKVRMSDTDMAGILYFAHQFQFVHTTLEDFFEKIGLPIHQMFHESPFVFVIVHAAGDYHKPLQVGDLLTIEMCLKKVGRTSFESHFEVKRSGELVGKVQTVHVCLDRLTRKKMEIPLQFRSTLQT